MQPELAGAPLILPPEQSLHSVSTAFPMVVANVSLFFFLMPVQLIIGYLCIEEIKVVVDVLALCFLFFVC